MGHFKEFALSVSLLISPSPHSLSHTHLLFSDFSLLFAVSHLEEDRVKVYFIPVTIDSDVGGTENIGEHTGVEAGAEKLRCYLADAKTHKRCYLIEVLRKKREKRERVAI